MGLIKWLFGIGDTVTDKHGRRVKIREHKPDGFVLVEDAQGNVRTEFGSTLKADDSSNVSDDEAARYVADS